MRANRLATRVLTALTSLLIAVLIAFGVSCVQEGAPSDKIGIIVTMPPQAEFVEKVGGENVDVTVMVPPGASPHTYEPTPNQMTDVARAEMYVKVGSGVEFELVWMNKIIAQNDDMLVVDCSEGIQLIEMAGAHEYEGEDYEHGTMDPHIWMSPLNARIMVQNICDGLVQIDPDNRAYYEANRDAYSQSLTQLDQDIRDSLSGVTNRTFMVYHPAFGYFAEAYELTMLPIEEEGKEPTASGLAHLIDQAKEHNIKVIFASPQFNPQSAEVIADEIGGNVVFIDSLAGDYIANLRTLPGELGEAMR